MRMGGTLFKTTDLDFIYTPSLLRPLYYGILFYFCSLMSTFQKKIYSVEALSRTDLKPYAWSKSETESKKTFVNNTILTVCTFEYVFRNIESEFFCDSIAPVLLLYTQHVEVRCLKKLNQHILDEKQA
jgi:hypothetical protein